MIKDVAQIVLIWGVTFSMVAVALWSLLKNNAQEDGEHYHWSTVLYLNWAWMMGDSIGDFPDLLERMVYTEESILVGVLHYGWVVLSNLIILNMLIAMMASTYQFVADNKTLELLSSQVTVYSATMRGSKNARDDILKTLYENSGKVFSQAASEYRLAKEEDQTSLLLSLRNKLVNIEKSQNKLLQRMADYEAGSRGKEETV